MRRATGGDWQLLCDLNAHRGAVLDLRFSPTGGRLASAGEDASATLTGIGPSGCTPQAQLTGHTASIYSVRFAPDGETLVTDAEVLQEILHRYVAIDRREAIAPATDVLLGVVDEVFPVERVDVERARRLVLATPLSARDAVHVAIMRRRGVERILSFDRGFDGVAGLARIG